MKDMIEVSTIIPGVSLVMFDDEPVVHCRIEGRARYYYNTIERLLHLINSTLGKLDPYSARLALDEDVMYYRFRKPRGLFVTGRL